MKKIRSLLRRERVRDYSGGILNLELLLDSREPFPLESKFILLSFYLICQSN